MNAPLLAKSYPRSTGRPPDYALLAQHSRDVAEACLALAEIAGPRALAAAGLSTQQERFTRALVLSGWLQDLGKANSGFQEMVRDVNQSTCQLLRHETISALLIWTNEQGLRDWLAPLEPVLPLALFAAVGHHRKFDESTQVEPVLPAALYLAALRPLLGDMATSLNELLASQGAEARLGPPPGPLKDRSLSHTDAARGLHRLRRDFAQIAQTLSPEDQRLLALLKAFGIAADVCASAVAKRGVSASAYSVRAFVQHELSGGMSAADVDRIIHVWAWNQKDPKERPTDVAVQLDELPAGFEARDFQRQVAASTAAVTLVEAGCGAGKSRAAYEWARARAKGALRLFFCLPTTGTTTEHYRDYALLSGVPAELAHSRAFVDLQTLASREEAASQDIAETHVSEEGDENEENIKGVARSTAAQQALRAVQDKILALSQWREHLVVTTADTVLGLLANARRSLCAAPALLQSAIVFDEVHAFDDKLFGHLLIFLKNFPALPVLLMTASLPPSRSAVLKAVRPDLHREAGPAAPQAAPRYLLRVIADAEEGWSAAQACVARMGKVLWVRNQVEWANDTYNACRERFPEARVDIYHSRLRYKDRSERHRQVIDRFQAQQREQALILVTTQVAEMSLNLSADLLVTDLAPVPSLIQRLGRLNREAQPARPKEAQIHLLGPRDSLPYHPADLQRALTWLEALQKEGRPLSQDDLSRHHAAVGDPEAWDLAEAQERACLLSGLWRTRPGRTRGEGYTINVILQQDRKAAGAKPTQDWLRKHEVAVTFRPEVLRWERVGGLPIAPEAAVAYDYDEDSKEGTGARWRDK